MFGIVRYSFTIVATFCVAALCGERAFGQVLKGEAAYGGWHDDRPGLRRLLTPQDLPPIEKPTYGLAQVVPIPTGARPQVPDGFSVERVTSALRKPRVIREAPPELSRVEPRPHATSAIDRYSTPAELGLQPIVYYESLAYSMLQLRCDYVAKVATTSRRRLCDFGDRHRRVK